MEQKIEFSNWRDAFAAKLQADGCGGKTVETYLVQVRVFEGWFEEQNGQPFELSLLTSWDIRAFREWSLTSQMVKPATWNLRLAALRALVKFAGLGSDAFSGVQKAEAVRQAPKWLTAKEFGQVMRQLEIGINGANTAERKARAMRDAAMVAFMVLAGMREAEVVGLRRADVVISERRGKAIIRLGKGEKYREVPLSVECRRYVSMWLGASTGEYLFDQMTTRALQKRISALGESAGVVDLTPHRLRHTCAKRMVDAGRPLTDVQEILGHSRLDTTSRYTQSGWEDLEEAVECVVLGKGKSKR
jgi:integrase/recombinase XerC